MAVDQNIEEAVRAPGIECLIGVKSEYVHLFLTRIALEPLALALSALPREAIDRFVAPLANRPANLIRDEIEWLKPVAPATLEEARRVVATLLAEMVRQGDLPAHILRGGEASDDGRDRR